jgi:hypothetical protein
VSRSWVVACTVAEAVGMTAAAGAAWAATWLSDLDVGNAMALGLTLVVIGGLVEGTALGWLQARALAGLLGPRGQRSWWVATVLVAGAGWAAASIPAAVAGNDGGSQPSLPLVIVAAAGLGALMGAALGSAQAWAVRRLVRRPLRWVPASIVGWTAAMPVIFAGASGVGATWAWWAVIPSGTFTGALAGWVLGATTAPFVVRLEPANPTSPGVVAGAVREELSWTRGRRTTQ